MDSYVKVAITLDDGSLSVMTFVTESRSPTLPTGAVWADLKSGRWTREPTDANVFAEISKAFPAVDRNGLPQPQPVNYKIVDAAEVPTDRTYRNAWTHDGKDFGHDMAKAREIHLDLVRNARADALGALDRDYTKLSGQALAADAIADKAVKDAKLAEAAAVEAKRQALRDAPQTLDVESAATIEELKALWPADLPRG